VDAAFFDGGTEFGEFGGASGEVGGAGVGAGRVTREQVGAAGS